MRKFELEDEEFEILKGFFKNVENSQANASCNDFEIESTPEMNLVVALAEARWHRLAGAEAPTSVELREGKVHSMDFILREYLESLLGINTE